MNLSSHLHCLQWQLWPKTMQSLLWFKLSVAPLSAMTCTNYFGDWRMCLISVLYQIFDVRFQRSWNIRHGNTKYQFWPFCRSDHCFWCASPYPNSLDVLSFLADNTHRCTCASIQLSFASARAIEESAKDCRSPDRYLLRYVWFFETSWTVHTYMYSCTHHAHTDTYVCLNISRKIVVVIAICRKVLADALAPTSQQWFRFTARLEGASVSKDRKDILRQY